MPALPVKPVRYVTFGRRVTSSASTPAGSKRPRSRSARLLNGVDNLALVIGLDVIERVAVRLRHCPCVTDELVEGVASVDLRLARAQHVQVRPRDEQDRHHCAQPSTPTDSSARSSAAAGGSSTRSKPLVPGRTKVSPPFAFLSRRINSTSFDASSPSGARP